MLSFIIVILFIPVLFAIIGISISAPRYHGPVTDHFDGKQFLNPGGVKAKGLKEVLKWMLHREKGLWKTATNSGYGKRPLDHYKDGIRITFVNHSTFLIQVDGLNILTDPVWNKRVSPFSWTGPRRMREPGIRFEDLPRIHLVLISHNHYDHLDLFTMRLIFGAHHPQIITPLGVKRFLDLERISGATDLDWWQDINVSNTTKVQCVPAQHFSGRGMRDRDATLWCGYVISGGSGKTYFAGDTGYNEHTFKEIGKRCGPFKVSILPIGAYKPKWFMSSIHTSPEDAVKIHRDIKSPFSIPSHFGTFPLADDGLDDPVNDLAKAITLMNLSADEFAVLKEGEARVFE
jgi:L-ascorbate metabolism protein UlaG (beta-lactamase superfamily)